MNRYIKEGGRSFHENKGRYRNPYVPGSSPHNDFERGWSQALKRSPDRLIEEYEAGKVDDFLTSDLIEHYERETKVIYRDEDYRVRDNGAIFREPKEGGRRRKLDSTWSFGRHNKSTGYANFCGEVVHRIVAIAFFGEPPSDRHIVDHIDTNRRNNRADNLRWITRLENILKNPITMRRIELCYGSIEAFIKDPSKPKNSKLHKDFEWMRAVSKEEAKNTKETLQRWAESGKLPQGGQIGEWVFGNSKTLAEVVEREIKESLTPGAFQKDWRTPTEFPACPNNADEDALREYANRLACGEVFSRNRFGASLVRVSEVRSSGFLSIVSSMESNPIKQWAVARVSVCSSGFVHQSVGSFFTLEGAVKVHCEQLGEPWKEYCDHHGLPWGESIDDYC